MEYTKKVCLISTLFIFVLASFLPASGGSSEVSIEDISQAAAQQLTNWLDKIPNGQERYFGFSNREEFKSATIGTPVHTFYFADEMTGSAPDNPNELLIPSYEWRVPVVVNNEYRALVTVAPVDGQWKIVDIGAAGLARELDSHKAGHLNILLRSFNAKSDFLVIPSGDHTGKGVMLMPLQSARRNISQLDHASKEVFTIDEIRGMILFPEKKPGVTR